MASIDVDELQRSTRRGYELVRARRALLGVLPVVLVVATAAHFTHRPASTWWFGAATLIAGAVMLWYGRDPQKAVLPGIGAGLVPLVFALCANQVHMCGPDGCSTLCVPACLVGGVVAGLAVASVGKRRRVGAWYWVSAGALAWLTGAMGCSCVGYSGLIGLTVGFGAGIVPGLLRRTLNEQAPK